MIRIIIDMGLVGGWMLQEETGVTHVFANERYVSLWRVDDHVEREDGYLLDVQYLVFIGLHATHAKRALPHFSVKPDESPD